MFFQPCIYIGGLLSFFTASPEHLDFPMAKPYENLREWVQIYIFTMDVLGCFYFGCPLCFPTPTLDNHRYHYNALQPFATAWT